MNATQNSEFRKSLPRRHEGHEIRIKIIRKPGIQENSRLDFIDSLLSFVLSKFRAFVVIIRFEL
jgi:hypothetical protein